MLQHKIHVSCFHLSFNCSRLVRFFSSNMFLRPIPPPPIFILHWKMWYNELMVSFQHLLLFLPTFDHSVYWLCCYRSTCLGRRWNISTTIMLSACFTLFTIWLTRLGLLINYESYHFFMDALSKCWSKSAFQTPNTTNSLCGYKIVTGQPSDRLGEDFSEHYKDFTER